MTATTRFQTSSGVLKRTSTLPGPGGIGLGTLRAIGRDPIGFYSSLPRRYGDLVRFRLGPYTWIVVNDPALIERVLVDDAPGYTKGVATQRLRLALGDGLLTSEDPLHARQRRLTAPGFAPRRLDAYASAMTRIARETVSAWRDGGVVDAAREMSGLTLRVVVATLFGSGLDAATTNRVVAALTETLEAFDALVWHPAGPLLARLPTRRRRRFVAARAELDAVVGSLIEARRRSGPGEDLLSELVAVRDDEGGIASTLLRDEVMTLVLAGHETTANWLSFALYAIASDGTLAARARSELDAVLGGREPGPADASRLPFLRSLLEETLRLYPPAWGIGRRAASDRELGGYRIAKGSVISISQIVVHRDERWWPDPLRFDPERFSSGTRPRRGAYFPFADGPRKCIAEGFARLEGLLVLATILQRVRVETVSDAGVALDPKVTLRPRGGLPLRIIRS